MSKYARTLTELKRQAVLFWPEELLAREASISVLPLLLKTQEKFISILRLSGHGPEAWQPILAASADSLKGSLFLKHLMVLTDLGGEALNKLPPLKRYFKNGKMNYVWRDKNYSYQFKTIVEQTLLHNSALKVDGKSLLKHHDLNDKMHDVVMLLLHAGSSFGNTLPESEKSKCVIGSLIGDDDALERFVKQSYIRISSQLRGATSNALGQIAQDYVLEILKRELPAASGWSFHKNGSIPGISHNAGETETTFDIVAASPSGVRFGIEVSFQFTTNSVIERKAGQAKARKDLLQQAGHYICYVVDGAGNINVRESAVTNLCNHSHCTVAFSEKEICHLADFLKTKAK